MRIAIFTTCLVESFAPEVAEAAARLVRRAAGPEAEVTLVGEACCGQPTWNAGYAAEARTLARQLIPRLLAHDLVVVPSGSCATMLLRYYPHLFPADDPMAQQAEALAARTRELSAYLADVDGQPRPMVAAPTTPEDTGTVAFHPSCHSLRGAFVGDAGQRCLAAAGCPLVRHEDAEECCGFGGLFAVKQPALSTAMADHKLDAIAVTGAKTVVSGEMGCLLHLEGRARRRGMGLRFRHLAEVLDERRQNPPPALGDPGEGDAR